MSTTRAGGTGGLLHAGIVLGVGLGGFADGILFHQILQWHNMLSSVVLPTDIVTAKVNMFWDGLFHALTWATTLAGIALLFKSARGDGALSGRVLVGGGLMGWGFFNFVEGIVDHQILGVHHVRPGDAQLAWDLAFLASGVALMVGGWLLARSAPRPRPVDPRAFAAA